MKHAPTQASGSNAPALAQRMQESIAETEPVVDPDSRVAVILGMHRSGTSAITRSLAALGFGFGDRLMPPVENNNPRGFWEDRDINRINVEVLAALGADWDAFQPLALETNGSRDALCAIRLDALATLRAKLLENPVFAVKDPRMARLLPFWNPLFRRAARRVDFIVALRNPLSVALSLRARDGFERVKSYYLWLAHMIDLYFGVEAYAANATLDRPWGAVVVDFNRLIQEPESQLQRVEAALGGELLVDRVALQDYRDNFLDDALIHSAFDHSDLDLDPQVPQDVKRVFSLFNACSQDQIELLGSEFKQAMLDCRARYSEIGSLLEFGWRSSRDLGGMRASAEQRARTIADLQKQVQQLDRSSYALKELQGTAGALLSGVRSSTDALVANLERQRDEAVLKLASAVGERDEASANYLHARNALEKAQAEIRESVRESERLALLLESEREESENRLSALKKEKEMLAAQLAAAAALHESESERNRREHASLEASLQDEIGKRDKHAEQLHDEVRQLRLRLDQAERELGEKVIETRDARREQLNASNRLNVATKELAALSKMLLQEQDNAAAARREYQQLLAELRAHRARSGFIENVKTTAAGLARFADGFSVSGLRRLMHRRTIVRSGMFDADWYLREYPDVLLSRLGALDHFVMYGSNERRSPGPMFDAAWYVSVNPDVAQSGMNPLIHWLHHGRTEGRAPRPGVKAG